MYRIRRHFKKSRTKHFNKTQLSRLTNILSNTSFSPVPADKKKPIIKRNEYLTKKTKLVNNILKEIKYHKDIKNHNPESNTGTIISSINETSQNSQSNSSSTAHKKDEHILLSALIRFLTDKEKLKNQLAILEIDFDKLNTSPQNEIKIISKLQTSANLLSNIYDKIIDGNADDICFDIYSATYFSNFPITTYTTLDFGKLEIKEKSQVIYQMNILNNIKSLFYLEKLHYSMLDDKDNFELKKQFEKVNKNLTEISEKNYLAVMYKNNQFKEIFELFWDINIFRYTDNNVNFIDDIDLNEDVIWIGTELINCFFVLTKYFYKEQYGRLSLKKETMGKEKISKNENFLCSLNGICFTNDYNEAIKYCKPFFKNSVTLFICTISKEKYDKNKTVYFFNDLMNVRIRYVIIGEFKD